MDIISLEMVGEFIDTDKTAREKVISERQQESRRIKRNRDVRRKLDE